MRSSTLHSSAFSRLRSCAGLSSLSKTTTSASASAQAAASAVDLAAAEERRRIRPGVLLEHARARPSAPAAAARPASSSSECSGSKWREDPVKRPTSAARSRVPFAVEREAARVTRSILARGPTRSRRRARAAAPRHGGPRSSKEARRACRRRRAPGRCGPRARAIRRPPRRTRGSPLRLALVAVMQKPRAAASARAMPLAGTRIADAAIVRPSTASRRAPCRIEHEDSGPGQNARPLLGAHGR